MLEKLPDNIRLLISSPRKFLIKVTCYIKAAYLNLILGIYKLSGYKNILIECLAAGQVYYTLPVYIRLRKRVKIKIYYSTNKKHPTNPYRELIRNGIPNKNIIDLLVAERLKYIDLYLSPDAFTNSFPRCNCIKVQMFHGLAMKDNILTKEILNFTTLFLPSLLVKNLFNEKFLDEFPEAKRIQLFKVGYPKSDGLIKKAVTRDEILKEIGLNPAKKTVIYAPTFNKEASLDKFGHFIIKALLSFDVNVIIKLHYASYDLSDYGICWHSRGHDWRKELRIYTKYPNFRNILDFNANPYLIASDIMIADAGGIGIEFKLLKKPIIYFDVPDFFKRVGTECIDYHIRDSELIAKNIEELKEKLEHVLSNYEYCSEKSSNLDKEVYNLGNAAEVAANYILALIEKRRYNRKMI